MPNHVHALIEIPGNAAVPAASASPAPSSSLSSILQSWKSYTAHEANKRIGRNGTFWMREYFDRFIRDEKHLRAVMAYIRENPVKAGLCAKPEDWEWSSAYRVRTAAGTAAVPGDGGTPALPGFRHAGYAPYLDYRPPTDEERGVLGEAVSAFGSGSELEQQAIGFAVSKLVPEHLAEVKGRNEERVLKTMAAVKDRLTVEINYWDSRAEELKLQEQAGKVNARLNFGKARQRADELETRLHRRLEELGKERQIAALSPVVTGGALVVPAGLLARLKGDRQQDAGLFAHEKKRVELLGMQAVMKVERELGNEPRDVSAENLGWDIESKDGQTGHLRFIEVKGRVASAKTVTVTRNEILASLNKPEAYILGIVLVPDSEELGGEDAWQVRESSVTYYTAGDCKVYYVTEPFDQESGFGVTSINYDVKKLLESGANMTDKRKAQYEGGPE